MMGTCLMIVIFVFLLLLGFLLLILSAGNVLVILGYYVFLMAFIMFWIFGSSAANKKKMRRYENVCIGMSEEEMLGIMGKGYNKSSLKNNRFKYEWRYSNGISTSYHGVRAYSGVSKVDIYISDGVVEEIRPYNC